MVASAGCGWDWPVTHGLRPFDSPSASLGASAKIGQGGLESLAPAGWMR